MLPSIRGLSRYYGDAFVFLLTISHKYAFQQNATGSIFPEAAGRFHNDDA